MIDEDVNDQPIEDGNQRGRKHRSIQGLAFFFFFFFFGQQQLETGVL
jgi:hypothetical protein